MFGISGYHGSELVAMGRIVGDGACHIQLCDIAVHPRLQRQGLGREVMLRLTAWLDQNLPPSSEVTLIAKGTSNLLYKQHGFVSTAPIAVSMCRRC
ncbi:GNAT family N-acetyltransferase [Xanthomonas citri]|uniref:GNAT family N-acetyltransferase n=1 Tax=Xanthomonas citri TaxID=346 RepID=UPI001CC25440|nr:MULTISPECIES: GNAT family N-acetyltransferase [Xanthomonas]